MVPVGVGSSFFLNESATQIHLRVISSGERLGFNGFQEVWEPEEV